MPLSDLGTRALYGALPLSAQHAIRDGGGTRAIFDGGVALAAVALAPYLLFAFLAVRRRTLVLPYGPSSRETIEVYTPDRAPGQGGRLTAVFVHGGAWGSGAAWMYSLCARGLVEALGATRVVFVNYKVYPDADMLGQVECLGRALERTKRLCADAGEGGGHRLVLCGHSSGAHISAMYLLDRCRGGAETGVDALVGLSGVYDVAAHLEWESCRGVAEVSPMKPAAGGEHRMSAVSPTRIAESTPGVSERFPPALLVHGTHDDTVPLTSTEGFAAALEGRGVPVRTGLLVDGGHTQPVTDLMELTSGAATARDTGDALRRFAAEFLAPRGGVPGPPARSRL